MTCSCSSCSSTVWRPRTWPCWTAPAAACGTPSGCAREAGRPVRRRRARMAVAARGRRAPGTTAAAGRGGGAGLLVRPATWRAPPPPHPPASSRSAPAPLGAAPATPRAAVSTAAACWWNGCPSPKPPRAPRPGSSSACRRRRWAPRGRYAPRGSRSCSRAPFYCKRRACGRSTASPSGRSVGGARPSRRGSSQTPLSAGVCRGGCCSSPAATMWSTSLSTWTWLTPRHCPSGGCATPSSCSTCSPPPVGRARSPRARRTSSPVARTTGASP
mmetsp:Transcript_2603/g.9433  ORF Transcript_2603/g.9433 Transcript_2603/m.9433 type:complete len:272 (-) Transcript_2603:404-1219(-)